MLDAQSTPSVNGPTVVGIYPNTPFLQTVGASNLGSGINFTASGLPAGLTLDPGTGIISGLAPTVGTYSVSISASGSTASALGTLSIVSGNTLSLTPPMGWNSWNSTYENDVTAQLLEQVANAMVNSGMRNAGYDYINIDDAWALSTRNAQGHLVPNPALYPNGLQPVIAYIHSLGLKFGIYTDAGTMTCSGAQPGSYGYEAVDAADFASWGVDYVKEDYCNSPSDQATAIARYTTMSHALQGTGRSIAFNICEWGQRQPWTWGQTAGGNSWRTTYDMRDNWQFGPASPPANQSKIGVLDAINLSAGREAYAGPGHWNDPDMIMAGVNGAGSSGAYGGPFLTTTEEQTQVSMWAMLAAPLIVNADIRQMDPTSPQYSASFAATYGPMLENNEIIKLDQDLLGIQASRVVNNTASGEQTWLKPLSDGSYAVALLNTASSSQNITVNWSDLGLGGQWSVRDLWAHANEGTYSGSYTATGVASHGTAVLELTLMSAPGVTLYWDSGGTTGGAWTGNNWNASSSGTGTSSAWVAGADAVFSAATAGTGSYTVSAGSVQTVRNLTVSAGNVTLANSGSFALLSGATWGAAPGGTLNVALPLITNGQTFTVNSAGPTTISGVISGSSGALTKTGSGTLTLTAQNSFTGGTIVNGGTLQANGPNSANGAIGAGNVTVNNGVITTTGDNAFVGYTTSSGKAVQINAGGLIIQASSNTNHLNALVLNGGTLSATSASSAYGNWDLDFGMSTPGNGTTSYITGGNVALTEASETIFNIGANDTVSLSAAIQRVSNTGVTDTGLIKTGAGLLNLSSLSNTYTSTTTVRMGTLQIGAAGAIPTGSGKGSVTFDSAANTAVLDLNGFNTTINGLVQNSPSTTNMVVNNASGTTKTLTVGNNNATSTFAGVLADNSNGGSGVLALSKTGSGTLTLLGNNSYTGLTSVAGGTLLLNGTNATSSISVAAATTLGGSGSANSAAASIASGGIVSAGYNGAGTLGLGGLAFLGGGTVSVSNVANYNSAPAINVATLSTSSTPITIDVSGTIPAGSGTEHIISYSGSIGGSGYNFVLAGPVSSGRNSYGLANHAGYVDFTYSVDYPYWTGAGNGSWTAANQGPNYNWTLALAGTGTNYLAGDNVLFDNRATNTAVTIADATVSPGSVTINNDGAHAYLFTGSGAIAGSTGLTKSGTGILTIANTNTYTGATMVLGGTLSVGADANLGKAPTSASAGNVVLNGGALSANSSFTLNANRGIALGPAGGSGFGTIDVSAANTLNYGGILANATGGTGGLIKTGNGTLNLSAVNSFSGPTTVNAGLAVLAAGGQYGTLDNSNALIINGGTVNAVNDNSIWGWRWGTVPNPVTINAGGLLTGGTGTSQGSTHLGPLSLSGGTLASNGYNSTWGGWYLDGNVTASGGTSTISAQHVVIPSGTARTFTVTAGAILNFNGSMVGTYGSPVVASGTLNVAGAGLLVVTGANGQAGGTTLSGGTTQLGNGGSSGDLGAAAIVNNAVLAFNRNDNPIFSNALSGTGTIAQLGPGIVTLEGPISGATTLLDKQGPGALILAGSNNYTGGTFVNAGTLILDTSTALADGSSLTVGQGASSLFAPAAGPAGVISAVPEPGTLWLLVAALWSAFGHRVLMAGQRFSRLRR
jgi:alpha-galactosidase